MNFFCDCKDKDEAKKLFHKLAKLFHPDHGGNTDLMIELKKQYDGYSGPVNLSNFTQNLFSNRNMPFDHSIHQSVRSLNDQIYRLNEEIRSLKVERNFAYSRCNDFKKLCEEKEDEVIELEEEVSRLELHINDLLGKIYKKSLFIRILSFFKGLYAKQS